MFINLQEAGFPQIQSQFHLLMTLIAKLFILKFALTYDYCNYFSLLSYATSVELRKLFARCIHQAMKYFVEHDHISFAK